MERGEKTRGMGGGGGFNLRSVIGHPFFILTLFFAVLGWIIAFISQIVAAGGGNGLDRYAWWVILFEFVFIFGIIFVVAMDGLAGYRLLFTACTAIGVVGCTYVCSQTIYGDPYGASVGDTGGVGSLKAVGAGYIFLSFSNICWLFYFCCEEDTMIFSALDNFAFSRGGGGGGGRGGGMMSKGSRRQDSVSDVGQGSGGYRGTSNRYGGGGVGNDPTRGMYGHGMGGNGYSNNSGSNRNMSSARSNQGHGPMVGSGLSGGAGAVGSSSENPARPASAASARPGTKTNRPASSRRSLDVTSPTGGSSNRPGTTEAPTYRARALYGYEANTEDPNEVSFAKGETLEIMDNSGKWWSAKNAAGQVGIVPSNYLQII